MIARWRTAPVRGGWRLEADYHDHRLSVRRAVTGRTVTVLYRAYLDGRPIGYWRSKEMAMTAAEWAALARNNTKLARPSIRKSVERPKKKAVSAAALCLVIVV